MKYLKIFLFIVLLPVGARAQTSDMIQLLLDIEKLTQLKGILTDMKRGYEIINGGYNTVKGIAKGNLNLHTVFLDGLLVVSPQVSNYRRVADIAIKQAQIVSEYKRYYTRFSSSGFNAEELTYLANVYSTLLKASLQNISELADILLSGKLRMSDDERLRAIDRIYADTEDKLTFLRDFNQRTAVMAIQRQREITNNSNLEKLY